MSLTCTFLGANLIEHAVKVFHKWIAIRHAKNLAVWNAVINDCPSHYLVITLLASAFGPGTLDKHKDSVLITDGDMTPGMKIKCETLWL